MTNYNKAKELIEKNNKLKGNSNFLSFYMTIAFILLLLTLMSSPKAELESSFTTLSMLYVFMTIVLPTITFYLTSVFLGLFAYGLKKKTFLEPIKNIILFLKACFHSHKCILNIKGIIKVNREFEKLIRNMTDEEISLLYDELICKKSGLKKMREENLRTKTIIELQRRKKATKEDLLEKMLIEKIEIENKKKRINHIN